MPKIVQVPSSYDDIKYPGIGEVVRCAPEVCEFEHRGQRLRLVLNGKRGRSGWQEEPVTSFEEFAGVDALGVEAWVSYKSDASAEDPADLLTALFMAMRKLGPKAAQSGCFARLPEGEQ